MIGNIFRIQHWPFGKEMVLVSEIALGILSLITGIRHYLTPNRSYLDTVGYLIVLLLICVQFYTLLPSANMIGSVWALTFQSAIWVLLLVITIIRKQPKLQLSPGKIILIAGLGCLIGEQILRWKHLPMATIFNVFGLLLTMLGLITLHSTKKVARKLHEEKTNQS